MSPIITGFVISLDRAVERWETLQSAFADVPIDLVRISAVDGRELDLTQADLDVMKRYHGRPFQPGEIGCYRSHLKALKTFLDSEHDFAIILEDDAIPTDLIDSLSEVIDAFKKRSEIQPSFLNLVKHPRVYFAPVAHISPKTELLRAYRFPINAAAVIWDRASAQAFLANYSTLERTYDCALRDFNSTHGGGLALSASLVVQSPKLPSEIEAFGHRHSRSVLYSWRRQAWRIGHKIKAARQMRKDTLSRQRS